VLGLMCMWLHGTRGWVMGAGGAALLETKAAGSTRRRAAWGAAVRHALPARSWPFQRALIVL